MSFFILKEATKAGKFNQSYNFFRKYCTLLKIFYLVENIAPLKYAFCPQTRLCFPTDETCLQKSGGEVGCYATCAHWWAVALLHCYIVREAFKIPSHGKVPMRGYPPPWPPRTRFLPKSLRKKVNEKGGYSPPLTNKNPKHFFGVFQPKNTVFGLKS